MAQTNVDLCGNRRNILPACERLSSKLDILTLVASTQCFPCEKNSSIKQNLHYEINSLKQQIKSDQDYLLTVKDDLTVIKDKIAHLEAWEDKFKRVDAVLPRTEVPVRKETGPLVNGLQQATATALGPISTLAGPKKGNIPTFRFIEDSEWSKVPNYLKLRLKLDQVNDFVRTLNKELTEKYSLLNRKKATLKKTELILRTSYMDLETPETKGLFFVVANDLKKYGITEKTVSSMSAILRHCRRLRELRSGKTIRLIVTT